MPLSSLHLDALLAVFRDLDVADVVRIGMTCKDLHQTTQGRHVWVDQLEKLLREDSVLRPATPPLTSLSTRELKTLVIRRTKLRFRMENGRDNFGFTARGLTSIPMDCDLILLPGGKYLLIVCYDGNISLRRIELRDGQASLPVITNVKSDENMDLSTTVLSTLLATMSPCPILVHGCPTKSIVHIFRIDHHNGAMSLEATFRVPDRYQFLRADGQGRMICFLIQGSSGSPRAIVIHLDHPGVVIQSDIPPTYALEENMDPDLWKVCIPTEDLLVTYSVKYILACKLPNFSNLSPGIHFTNVTPMWSWPGLDQPSFRIWMTSEAIYGPLSAREFDLYYAQMGMAMEMITVNIPIDTSDDADDPSSKSGELPVLKQETTHVQSYENLMGIAFFLQKGLYICGTGRVGGIHYLIIPLKGFTSHGPMKVIQLFVSHEELNEAPQTIGLDEATGRAVVWGWDAKALETKIIVGDLV